MASIFLNDRRVKCVSGIGTMSISEYIDIINIVYKANGGIEGQRAPLKTKTGINIRNRMIEDIRKGAILPPIVIGSVVDDDVFEKAKDCNSNEEFQEIIRNIDESKLSIIDGMQRTTALEAALKANQGNLGKINESIRIDLWLAKSLDSLIYRMLVLNTGQVPWDIKRQLETIYKQVLLDLKSEVPSISVFNIDDTDRRSDAGQYRSTRIVELFLAFTSRRPHIELKEKVAEDFARMDATEATSNENLLPLFIETMKLLARLDEAFATTSMDKDYIDEGTRFKEGRDIFTSAPASIAFSAAASQFLLGKPGYPFEFELASEKLRVLQANIDVVCNKIRRAINKDEFIDYLTLNQKITARSGRIGEYEREFFHRAFEHMFQNAANLETLNPCWFAYR
ncbi:hypothetical protein [Azospirillum argentinense]